MADTMLQIVPTTVVILRILLRMRETAIFPLPACYSLLCAYVRKNFCRTQVVRFFVRVAHDDGILFIERLLQWAYSLSIACLVCQFIFKMIKKTCKFDHLIACSDYFAQFLLLKRAFSMKKVMLKNSRTLSYA